MPEVIAALCVLSAVWIGVFLHQEHRRRRAFQERMRARWRILVESAGNATYIYVYRDVDSTVMDRTLVARVPHADADWRGKVQTAKVEAADRIATLEAEC